MYRRPRTSKIITLVISLIIFAIVAYRGGGRNFPAVSLPAQSNTPQVLPAPELSNATCRMVGVLPDPTCTPGANNPDVTQSNIAQTICVSGYTKSIRPPVTYTDNLKFKQMVQYGFTNPPRTYEEDHLISLELGGSPADPKNLWPEPGASPNPKDKVENFLHDAVCSNRITLDAARARIATNWTTAEQGL